MSYQFTMERRLAVTLSARHGHPAGVRETVRARVSTVRKGLATGLTVARRRPVASAGGQLAGFAAFEVGLRMTWEPAALLVGGTVLMLVAFGLGARGDAE